MASEKSTIRNYAKTGIVLDELAVPNRSGNKTSPNMTLQDADEKQYGYYKPLVFLNGYFVEKFLLYFDLDFNQIIPTLRFRFYTGAATFLSISYPKDGDIVSVYIRSNVSVYKPFRMDFNILSVNSGMSTDPTGETIQFDILAECRVPRFYAEVCKAFRQKTSYETLFEVSQDLNLGFSTNDPSLNDRMTWICPNLSYYNFIKEVTKSCYKDDRSFYMTYIDPYYNLTFLNINNQLEAENVVQEAIVQPGSATGKANDALFPGIDLPPATVPLQVTNAPSFIGYPFYATRYTLLSESGNNSNLMGYVQTVQFYDENASAQNSPNEKYVAYDIETITTEDVVESMVLQKGRASENLYQEEIRKRWMGILNSGPEGSVHENYLQARVQNPFNLTDVTKFTLQVETGSYYAGYYRGQVIPVMLYATERGTRMDNTGLSNNQSTQRDNNVVLDQFLSGKYILMGYSVRWSSEKGFYQVLNLCKREWILNSAGKLPKAFPVNVFTNTVTKFTKAASGIANRINR
jgi:hypothetical protein